MMLMTLFTRSHTETLTQQGIYTREHLAQRSTHTEIPSQRKTADLQMIDLNHSRQFKQKHTGSLEITHGEISHKNNPKKKENSTLICSSSPGL